MIRGNEPPTEQSEEHTMVRHSQMWRLKRSTFSLRGVTKHHLLFYYFF